MDIYEKTARFFEDVTTEKRVIGSSLFGRNLYAMKLGNGRPMGLAQYAIHGREFVTAELAFVHYHVGLAEGSLWLLPLMNPDGALLSQRGLTSVEDSTARENLRMLGGEDFSLWKANGRGVDLNVNFPARWGSGKQNIWTPGAENFVGEHPFSEPETQVLKRFTEEIQPDYTLSYHTKGEEIYWYFYQSTRTCPRDKALAAVLSDSTGYPLAEAKGSAGGYKDWCIQALGIPAFTIEAGSEKFKHPLGVDGLEDIIKKNKFAIYDLSKEVKKYL